MKKSNDRLMKEMDLKKFITRQRLATTALLGLLTGQQTFFIDKMSQLVIDEERCLSDETTSDDDDLDEYQKDCTQFAERMASSKNPVDKRFLRLYMLSKARDQNMHFGYNNELLLTSYAENQVMKQKMQS